MGRDRVSVVGRGDVAGFRDELLGRLGLSGRASDQDIELAHEGLVEFLGASPQGSRSWAAGRVAEVDEAFVLLSGPVEELAAAAAERVVEVPGGGSGVAGVSGPVVTRAAVLAAFRPGASRWWWAVVPVVLAVVVFAVYSWGGGSSVPGASGPVTGKESSAAPSAAAAAPAAVPVDKVKVAALMKKISADPKDVGSLLALGDMYFAAEDYKAAAGWQEKVLFLDPKNQGALLSLGAARFNAGDKAGAEKQWLVAARLYPNLAEVHYDLGFLYMSQKPPQLDKVRAHWNKVVAIDPTSAVAKTVATHLKGLDSPAPGASGTPSPK